MMRENQPNRLTTGPRSGGYDRTHPKLDIGVGTIMKKFLAFAAIAAVTALPAPLVAQKPGGAPQTLRASR